MSQNFFNKITKLENRSISDCETSGIVYWTNGKEVFYGQYQIPIEHADVSAFYCAGNFAFDDRQVYWKREVIKGVSPKGFTVLNHAFMKTESHVISQTGKVKIGLDSNIEIYDQGKWYEHIEYPKGYIRIDDAIYYEGNWTRKLEKLTDVNVDTFFSYKNGVYGKDDEKVYAFGKIMKNVKAKEFHMLADTPLCGYGIYGNDLYFQDELVPNADVSSIKIPKAVLESGSHIFLLEGNGKYYVRENEVSVDIFKKWISGS